MDTPEESALRRKARKWTESSTDLDAASNEEAQSLPGGLEILSDGPVANSEAEEEANSHSTVRHAMMDIMNEIGCLIADMPPPSKRMRSETPSLSEVPNELPWPLSLNCPVAKDTSIPSLIEMTEKCDDIEVVMDGIAATFPPANRDYSRKLHQTFLDMRLGLFRYRNMATKRMAKMLWVLAGKNGLELQREAAGMVGVEFLPDDLQEFGLKNAEVLDEEGIGRRHQEAHAFLNPIFSKYHYQKGRAKPNKRPPRSQQQRKEPAAIVEDEEEEEFYNRSKYDIYSSRKDPEIQADRPYKLRGAPLSKKSARRDAFSAPDYPPPVPPPSLPLWEGRRRRTGWHPDRTKHTYAEILHQNGRSLSHLRPQSAIGSRHKPQLVTQNIASQPQEQDVSTPDAQKLDAQDVKELLGNAFDIIVSEISKKTILTALSGGGDRGGDMGSPKNRDPRMRETLQGVSPRKH